MINFKSNRELVNYLENEDNYGTKAIVYIPFIYIGNANSLLDFAEDYAFSSYVCETIKNHYTDAQIEEKNRGVYISFTVVPQTLIPQKLGLISKLYIDEEYDSYEDESEEAMLIDEEYTYFKDGLTSNYLNFPDLGDSYFANLIAGSDDFLSSDEESNYTYYKEYPERLFGYWLSCHSIFAGRKIYMSMYSSIMALKESDNTVQVQDILACFDIKIKVSTEMHKALILQSEEMPMVVFNQYSLALYPRTSIRKAQKCASFLNSLRYSSYNSAIMESLKESADLTSPNLWLSEDGGIMIGEDNLAYYIFFKQSTTFNPDLELVLDTLPKTLEIHNLDILNDMLQNYMGVLGIKPDIKLSWENLDDEKFEQLCYDLLYIHEEFEGNKLEKYGNSRSRDGGRDIVAYKYREPWKSPIKFIVQCKYKNSPKALSGSNINMADTVLQYKAQGYMIITNSLIDSTIHDKLDRIGENLSIETKQWDKLALERLLAKPKYTNIRKRYFEN